MRHLGTKTLETSRLILRRAVPEDAGPMFRNWASDPEVTKYLTWPTHGSAEISAMVVESWMRDYEKSNFYQWMMVCKATGEPIGSISVVDGNDWVEKAEIGYCIGRNWWHMGLTTEALRAVIDFLFEEVGMNRIEAGHDVANPNSGAVMKKCGMRFEGISRAGGRNNQGICDMAHYAILRSDRDL